jgi:sulfite reductase alpha subunit-like flavoprotein
MLAPGLGVAPMRSFIHYRNSLLTSVGQTAITCLFYGCRFENKDFLYKDELESLHSKGGIQLFVAFSRDEPRHRHQYVQDVLFEQRRLINSLLEQGAQLFICGDSKQMPSDVMRVLKEIIKEFCPDKDVDQYVNELRRSKRIQTETW